MNGDIDSEPFASNSSSEASETTVESRMGKFRNVTGFRIRSDLIRECMSEFLATFLLVLLGDGTNAVCTLSEEGRKVAPIAGPIGWAFALLVAIAVTGGVSGCHANPAVTLALASVGKLPWRKVSFYWISQYIGAFLSAAVLYGVYYEKIIALGPVLRVPPHANATAGIFATYAAGDVNILTTFFDQVVATAVLLIAIAAITDPNNMAISKGLYPLLIGLSLGGIIMAFPMNCGAPLNPARDMGPRILTVIAGYGKDTFGFRNYAYFWVPIIGPHIGGLVGIWIYTLMIEQHWPVESYDLGGSPSEVRTQGQFKKKDDLPQVEKKGMR